MKAKTIALTGPALDWAVAKALGAEFRASSIGAIHARVDGNLIGGFTTRVAGGVAIADRYFCPSTNWHQGGPIIERERITLRAPDGRHWPGWRALYDDFGASASREVHGPTSLIAAMRCFVASKLGADVDVPDEIAE